jgi:hypothetical protein
LSVSISGFFCGFFRGLRRGFFSAGAGSWAVSDGPVGPHMMDIKVIRKD